MVKGQWAGKNVRWGRVCRPLTGGQRTSPSLVVVGLLLVLLLGGCSFGDSSGGTALPPHYGRTKACLDALDAAQQLVSGSRVHQREQFLVGLLNRAFTAGARGDLVAGQRVIDELTAEEQPPTRLTNTFDAARAKCVAKAAEGRSP